MSGPQRCRSRGSFKAAAWLLERNERLRKPTQEELREAAEERERSEQAAHERELRKARVFKEFSDVASGRSAAQPATHVGMTAAATKPASPVPAGQEESTAELIKRMFAEVRNWDDDNSYDDEEDEFPRVT